jgi:CRP-like cAMP-binding protein
MNNFLRTVAAFSIFSDEALAELIAIMQQRICADQETIFGEGDIGEHLFVVVDGTVEIRKNMTLLAVFGPGSIFGEMALFEAAPRSAAAIARGGCTLQQIGHSDFMQFVDDHPAEGVHFLFNSAREMSRRLRVTTEFLNTVYETGIIIASTTDLAGQCSRIVEKLIADIDDARGGLVLAHNPFSAEFDTIVNVNCTCPVGAVASVSADELTIPLANGIAYGAAIRETGDLLGWLIIEKGAAEAPFAIDEKIIIGAVAGQIGMGILRAYDRQEEEARQRLAWQKMRQ